MAREAKVEECLKQMMEIIGGAAEKHVNPGHRGDPDRLVTFSLTRYACLVETKWKEGVEPAEHQLRRHKWWRQRGIDVYVLRSRREIKDWLLGPMWYHWNKVAGGLQ